jgi:hypothetical protein
MVDFKTIALQITPMYEVKRTSIIDDIGIYGSAVLRELDSLFFESGRFNPTEASILVARNMSDDPSSVSDCLRELARKGYIHSYFSSDMAASKFRKNPSYCVFDPSVRGILEELKRKNPLRGSP